MHTFSIALFPATGAERGYLRIIMCKNQSKVLIYTRNPGHSAKNAGDSLQQHTHTSYVCGFHEVTWCMVVWCTQNAPETAAVPCGTSHANAVSTYTTSVDIQKRAIKKKLFTHAESYTSAVSLLERGE